MHDRTTVHCLFLSLLLFSGCTGLPVPEPQLDECQAESCLTIDNVRRPNGNEIAVEAFAEGDERLVVVVTNRSSTDVYLPYLPGINSENAWYTMLEIERLNISTGEFESTGGGTFGTGWHPLAPGATFRWTVVVEPKATYRVLTEYFVDSRVADMLRAMEKLRDDDREEWRARLDHADFIEGRAVKKFHSNPVVVGELELDQEIEGAANGFSNGGALP